MESIEDMFADLPPVRVKFWVCPDHRRTGRVEWDGPVARCVTCGRTNKTEASA